MWLEKNFWRLVSGFLQTLPHVTFSFANFVLCCFAAINLESWIWLYAESYTYTASSPAGLLNLEVVLGSTELVLHIIYFLKREEQSTHTTEFLWVYNSVYTYFLKFERIHIKLITVINCGERKKEEVRRGLSLVEISQREFWLFLACSF